MVSPHSDWNDVDDGYRNAGVGIFVKPSIVRSSPGTMFHQTAESPEDANAFAVTIRTSMETASETLDVVTHFEDARAAWELANILTHYFAAAPAAMSAKSNLLHGDPHYSGDPKDAPDLVEDLTADETFRRLIHPRPVPDEVTAVLDED